MIGVDFGATKNGFSYLCGVYTLALIRFIKEGKMTKENSEANHSLSSPL